MHSASELADWWERNRRESDKALDAFVDAHPHLWVIAALTATAMDVGAGTVDLLRFGEGAAESYETGKIAPLLQDVLRGVTIATSLSGVAKSGFKMKLYSDPGGGLCGPIAIGNALRRTGQRILLSLDEIIEASGLPKARVWDQGITDTQFLATLRKLGVSFDFSISRAATFEELTTMAKKGEGVVSLPLNSPTGGHFALLEKMGSRVRIVDRSGFYDSLEELSRRYRTTFSVDGAAPIVFIKRVTARLLNGVATLMMTSNGLVAKLSGDLTVPELDAKFKAFKAGSPGSAPLARAGAPTHRVVSGDTLSGLALKNYGSEQYWPLLWDTNRGTIGPNPNRLATGAPLQIPPFSSFTAAQKDDARRRHGTWRNF